MMCKDTIKIFMNNICRDKMNYINAFFTLLHWLLIQANTRDNA